MSESVPTTTRTTRASTRISARTRRGTAQPAHEPSSRAAANQNESSTSSLAIPGTNAHQSNDSAASSQTSTPFMTANPLSISSFFTPAAAATISRTSGVRGHGPPGRNIAAAASTSSSSSTRHKVAIGKHRGRSPQDKELENFARAIEMEERLTQTTNAYDEKLHQQRMETLVQLMVEARKENWRYSTIDSLLYGNGVECSGDRK